MRQISVAKTIDGVRAINLVVDTFESDFSVYLGIDLANGRKIELRVKKGVVVVYG